MQLFRFIPVKLTIYLILGILLGHYLHFGIIISSTLTVFFLAVLGWIFIRNKRKEAHLFAIMVFLTTISLGVLSISLATPENYDDHYSYRISGYDVKWRLKILEVMKPTTFSARYIAEVHRLENHRASGKVLLSLPKDTAVSPFEVDDELISFGQAEEIGPALNPHQFDYKNYLKNLGISHQLRLNNSNYIVLKNQSPTLYGVAASFRNKIISKLKTSDFGNEELAIIQALLLGQRHDISVETYNNYKNAGAVHILAVSGLHIGILLFLLQFLLRPLEYLPKGKTIKLIVTLLLLWGFAFLAGLSASIVRAVTMFTFVAYALFLNRPGNTFNILALSMFFILLVYDPKLLFQVGFQMSYAAVFAIVRIYPLFQKLWHPKNWFTRKVWQLLSVSIAAQLGVLPIGLYYFHQFPGLFFVSNLLIVPFLGLILGLGILVILLSLFNILPDALVKIYDFAIGSMNKVVEWVAQREAFIFKDISFDHVQLLLVYAIMFYLLMISTKVSFKRAATLLALVIGFQLWMLRTSHRTARTTKLILAHQTRNSVLMHHNGNRLTLMTNKKNEAARLAADYKVAERIDSVGYQELKNSYSFRGNNLLIIDSLGVYGPTSEPMDYIVLTESPKINLERLIDSLHPKSLIADGSNYKSDIERWRTTCKKRRLPFHYTGEKGAYYFIDIP
ncbi:ComEC/Rec2 family competence protein [Maribacter algicola]|uniref:ComEC/Rec2 family competence protein n=1 Tax=Meishania litoralis TaxID=3434685 RepID=A0ACC7LJ50_9FLAO